MQIYESFSACSYPFHELHHWPLVQIFFLGTVFIHVALAVTVWVHLMDHPKGPQVNSRLWAVGALLGGILVAIPFWRAHRPDRRATPRR